MGRIKIRNYPSREWIREVLDEYFIQHREEVVAEVLKETGYATLDELLEAERRSVFGLDCGWVKVHPINGMEKRVEA